MTDSPAAPDRSLQAQPATEDIANALQIAETWVELYGSVSSYQAALGNISRLLHSALAKLEAK